MQIEKIKLGEGISVPIKLMQVMNVASGEKLTVLCSEAGIRAALGAKAPGSTRSR